MGMPISSAGAQAAVISQPVKPMPAPVVALPPPPAAPSLNKSGPVGTKVNTTA